MPPDSRTSPIRGAALAALALAVAGCATGFVDPNAPVLQRLDRVWTPPVENEPVVYAPMLDLHLARGLDCAGIKAQVASQLRSILITPAHPGLELPLVDLSPGCRQAPDRHFDPNALDAAIQGAERTDGASHVRALLVYVNDIDLPIPATVQSDFSSLRILLANRGAPLPIPWGLVLGRGKDQSLFQRIVGWSQSDDTAMFGAVATMAGAELPLVALGSTGPAGVPLFSPQEAASAVEFKFCGPADQRIVPINFGFDGKPRRFSAAAPPGFTFDAPALAPVMKSGFSVQPVRFQVELCTANCDHYARLDDGSVAIWDQTTGCTLPAVGSGT